MENEEQIIIIKKSGGHAGHHGGAWKVAYADFVTAMMSLFIVLWLMSSTSKQTQQEIAGYFNDPKGTSSKHGADPKPSPDKQAKDDMAALKADIVRAINEMNSLDKLKNQIEITITEEGLRIELIEDQKGTFFESGSAQATPVLAELLKVLTLKLKNLPNNISIEGHTDAQPYASNATYSNWELSTDRANVARREMQQDGMRESQISQVRGFAAQRLHIPSRPLDPANRRVSLVVQNLGSKAKLDGQAAAPGTKSAGAGTPAAPAQDQKASAASAHATAAALAVTAK
jgi:chemotaxis protein MotB